VSPKARQPLWIYGVLLAVSVAAYSPALMGSFVWDDDAHVTKPALQSIGGLVRIWTELGATQQYYPLLHTAFWFEHGLWGDAALPYHLVNVLLHFFGACLFAEVLQLVWKKSDPAAFFGACLFALHPVAVESVAWVSEQKNTLSGVFYLAAAIVFLRWLARRDQAEDKGAKVAWNGYLFASGLFFCALLTKSVTATLPAALLVVLWYQRGKLRFRQDVVPLLPWLAAGVAMGLFTAWVESSVLGASGSGFDLSFPLRGLLAARIALFYLGKLLWPWPLLFVYSHWTISSADLGLYGGMAVLLSGMAGLVVLAARGRRGPLAAALFFLGTLFPALGFFNVYPFLFSYVADHFQYLAMLGVFAVTAAGWSVWRGRAKTKVPDAAAVALLLVLTGLTWRQAGTYRTPEILYRSVLSGNPNCWMAEYSLAVTLHQQGRVPEAMGHYERAIALRPQFPQAQNNLGVILIDQGQGTARKPRETWAGRCSRPAAMRKRFLILLGPSRWNPTGPS
jgi:hypothetical protein